MANAPNLPKSGLKYSAIKRILDITLAAAAVALLFLPMLLIAVAIYVDDPGKVIFAQYRIGVKGKTFLLYKFRTMRRNAPQYVASGDLHHSERYITRLGHFLRKSSLAELPQLINVIRGDMSLVGPRPLIPQEELIHLLRQEYGVYTIRPGMTGLAQINGRDRLSADEKVSFDVAYMKNFGFMQDFSILLRTLSGVFRGEGVVEGPAISERLE